MTPIWQFLASSQDNNVSDDYCFSEMSEAFCMRHVAAHVMLNDGNHTNFNYYLHRCYCWHCCRESTNHSFFFVLLDTPDACANVRRVDTLLALLRSALLSINNLRHSGCPLFDAINTGVSPSYVHECTGVFEIWTAKSQ